MDLGATSIRVASVDLGAEKPHVEILHRWRHSPITDAAGHLRWDWPAIIRHVEKGLTLGIESGPVASIGVDGWGVDYGLLDEAGGLVDLPYAYLGSRTVGWESVADRIGVERLYRTTGIQLMGLNTIFQLEADPPGRQAAASNMLLLPDLLVNHLTGWIGCERSNMSTTGLMDARSFDWSGDLVNEVGVDSSLLPRPALAGTPVGEWQGVPVHLVGSHDTASAFLGMPARPDGTSIFVSAGSWVIVGVEQEQPDTSPGARRLNFSNEAGALRGVRFLKNVVGFWMLEQCRSAWGDPSIEELIEEANSVQDGVPTFDAMDHRFVGTDDMVADVREAAGLIKGAPRSVIVRSIIESIVSGVIGVVDDLEDVTGVERGHIVVAGGASRISLLAELLATRSGLDVTVGSPEAAALGNAVVQALALGHFTDISDARAWLSSTSVAA